MRRELLAGVTLDPAWDEFDSSSLNAFGNYLFGVSPRLASPVTFTSGSTPLGPLDTAMVAAFTAALPAITTNIQNSVANAANYNPQTESESSEKTFYRFSADWSVDSDGDSRFDWEEILFDGNNPFAADSDGDGIPDQAPAGPAPGSETDPVTGLPLPTDAQPATPLAHVQQQTMSATRQIWHFEENDTDPYTTLYNGTDHGSGYDSSDPDRQALEGAGSFSAFKQVVNGIAFEGENWQDVLFDFSSVNTFVDLGDGANSKGFEARRERFRLKLDAPAPEGGYKIPLRIAQVYLARNSTGTMEVTSSPDGVPPYLEIMLEVPAGETDGIPVNVPIPDLAENQTAIFVPGSVTTRENDLASGEAGPVSANGICVTGDETFVVDFGSHGSTVPMSKISWQKRKLNGDGSFGEWGELSMPADTGEWYSGAHAYVRCREPGSYQMQALLVLPDGRNIEFPFVRLKNARSIMDGRKPPRTNDLQKAGAPDFFGIAGDQMSIFIRNKAVSWLGSKKYNKESPVITDPQSLLNPNLSGHVKCNVFVAHVLNSVGANTPYYTHLGYSYAPIARDDWYGNPGVHVHLYDYDWQYGSSMTSIQPGSVIASFGTEDNGHVGILDYDGTWISAGSKSVNKYLSMQELEPHYKPFNIRMK